MKKYGKSFHSRSNTGFSFLGKSVKPILIQDGENLKCKSFRFLQRNMLFMQTSAQDVTHKAASPPCFLLHSVRLVPFHGLPITAASTSASYFPRLSSIDPPLPLPQALPPTFCLPSPTSLFPSSLTVLKAGSLSIHRYENSLFSPCKHIYDKEYVCNMGKLAWERLLLFVVQRMQTHNYMTEGMCVTWV